VVLSPTYHRSTLKATVAIRGTNNTQNKESQLLLEKSVHPKHEIRWGMVRLFGALNDLRVNGPGSTSCTSSYQTPSAGGGTSAPYTTCRYTPIQTLMRCRRGSWTNSSRISTQTSGETRYARGTLSWRVFYPHPDNNAGDARSKKTFKKVVKTRSSDSQLRAARTGPPLLS
jgi:hypothetical protein